MRHEEAYAYGCRLTAQATPKLPTGSGPVTYRIRNRDQLVVEGPVSPDAVGKRHQNTLQERAAASEQSTGSGGLVAAEKP
jgi:hypothetical protein